MDVFVCAAKDNKSIGSAKRWGGNEVKYEKGERVRERETGSKSLISFSVFFGFLKDPVLRMTTGWFFFGRFFFSFYF